MLTYIIKAILFSALLLAIYHLFLEREKMHRFNRSFLLLSITLPFIVPLIAIPALSLMPRIQASINLTGTSQVNSIITDSPTPAYNMAKSDPAVTGFQNTISQPASTSANGHKLWFILLLTGYIIVTLALLYRFIRNILSIYLTIKNNKSVPYLEGTLVLTKDNRKPHSFLKYIFVNREDFERGSIEKEILSHELTHVRQYHSLDILFVELITVFAWINPLLFFCRKAVRLNHEFLADQSVIESFSDTKAYQLLLFKKVRQSNSLSLSSPFNYLSTKKRLKMMCRKASPGIAIFKKITITPLIAIAGLAFTNSSAHELADTAQQNQVESTPNGNGSWELVSRADESGNVIKEIIGEFEGRRRMENNVVLDAPIKVKIFITKRKGGEMYTEFYESGSETPARLYPDFENFTKLILYITIDSGDIIEIEQFSGGSHMWDFNIKDVTPPDSPEGLRYGEPREGDFLNLILEQDEIISVRVQFHPATHKIYRFDIDPAGLQELFEKL